jgi:putative ABC transport system permease protein
MHIVMRLFRRAVETLNRNRRDGDAAREIASHLALLEDEYRRRGLPEADARFAARRALGSAALAMDAHRDARSLAWVDDLRWDLAYAARLLRRNPVFASTAALSLAVGIGANTTIFTVAHALLFQPPAGVVRPDRLVDIGRTVRRGNAFNPASYPDYVDLRARATLLDGVYATSVFPIGTSLAIDASGAERVFASRVSLNYFEILGVVPAAGRLFGRGDSEQPGASPIVVLSHPFWMRRCNGDPAAVGRAVRVDGEPFTIVGVAPEGFQGTGIRAADLWVPLTMSASATGTSMLTNRAAATVVMGARLTRDATIGAAAAEADAIAAALGREHPEADAGKGLRVLPASPVAGEAGPIAAFLVLLTGIVSIVLVVACVNVAGVLLARAAARRHEIAVRVAIGAGRGRLVRQLITETVLLFAIGGAAGLGLARALTSIVVATLPALPFPIDIRLPLDGSAIAFTAAVSFVAALACGLVPALQAAKTASVDGLRADAAGVAGRARLRHAFLVAQIAFSVVLVVVAGLFVRALERVSSRNPGFDPAGVEIAALDLSTAGFSAATAPRAAREIVEQVRRLPGVERATIASSLPSGFERMTLAALRAPGGSGDGAAPQGLLSADWNIVEPGYFATLKIALLAGRDFTAADTAASQPVAIIGAGAARRFFADGDAVGRYIFPQHYGPPSAGVAAEPLRVVGVVADPTYGTLVDGMTGLYVYVPLPQRYVAAFTNIVVRSASGASLATEVRAAIRAMNPNVPVGTVRPARDITSLGLMPQRMAASIAGSLGVVGLLLAALGLYGVTAYAVARRTREFGVRLALGATRGDVLRIVLRHGLALTVAGSLAGLMLAAGAAQLASSMLFGVTPGDPPTLAVSALAFVVVGVAASLPPALRATRINPVEALRQE